MIDSSITDTAWPYCGCFLQCPGILTNESGPGCYNHIFICIIFQDKNMIGSLILGSWGSWRDWSKCSRSCGGGSIVRRRACDSQQATRYILYTVWVEIIKRDGVTPFLVITKVKIAFFDFNINFFLI